MCMCAYPFLPSIVIISLQTFFQFNFFAMTWMPQKHVKHQTLQATNTFFVLKKKKKTVRGCINMFGVIFVSPKFYSVFKG